MVRYKHNKIILFIFIYIFLWCCFFYKIRATNQENTNLETLAVQDVLLYPPFDNTIIQYKADIPNETEKLNILAIPENEFANVQIVGNDKLIVGDNLVKIIVTAENGVSKKVFEINFHRRNKKEEEIYKNEQEENKNKLEKIYKARANKVSNEYEEAKSIENYSANKISSEKVIKKGINNKIFIGVIVGVGIILLVMFIIRTRSIFWK